MRVRTLLGLTAILFVSACSASSDESAADTAASAPVRAPSHVYLNDSVGIAVDLPISWAGRYQESDSIDLATPGLTRQLALRYRQTDGTVSAAATLLTLRIFSRSAWDSLPTERRSTFGALVADGEGRVVTAQPANASPFAAGHPDAASFDSLMFALGGRPFRVSLRNAAADSTK